MLTVAHGTFCLIDIGDASIRAISTGGGNFNVVEFFMRLNIVGVGRFTISLYGEIKRGVQAKQVSSDGSFIKREKVIVDDYINGLMTLSEAYDDKELLSFVADLKESGLYKESFEKTVLLAKKRNVPDDESIKSKAEIDAYFQGGSL